MEENSGAASNDGSSPKLPPIHPSGHTNMTTVQTGTANVQRGAQSVQMAPLVARDVSNMTGVSEVASSTLAHVGESPSQPHKSPSKGSLRSSRKTLSRHGSAVNLNVNENPYTVQIPTRPELLAKKNQNYIRTTKYTLLTFLPLNLYYQFNRIYNIYFLFAALTTLSGYSSLSPITQILPLIVVLLAGAIKDGFEDYMRYRQDRAANNTVTTVLRDGKLVEELAKDIRMGDVMLFKKNEKFAVDCVIISSSYDDGTAFVDTAELDGETNLKRRSGTAELSHLKDQKQVEGFHGKIESEHPNQNLLSYEGRLVLPDSPSLFLDAQEIKEEKGVVVTTLEPSVHAAVSDSKTRVIPLSINNLLLRGAILRNTDYCWAVVLFTGSNTKIMKNLRKAGQKRSNLERSLNRFTFAAFLYNMFLLISSILLQLRDYYVAYNAEQSSSTAYYWYLQIKENFFSFFAVYTYVIPISLFVSIEIARLAQGLFMNWDDKMMYIRTMPDDSKLKQRMRPNNTSLNEELAQVEYVFSDKTGTLTQNDMKLAYWYINKKSFHEMGDMGILHKTLMSNTLPDGSPLDSLTKEYMILFMRTLGLAHGVIPAKDDKTGKIIYESQSPDESALLNSIRDNQVKLMTRSKAMLSLTTQFDLSKAQPGQLKGGVDHVVMRPEAVPEEYEQLCCMEFTSDRKRMSVIVRTLDGRIHLYCKGADNIILARLDKDPLLNPPDMISDAVTALADYSTEGLRTLVIAWKPLTEAEFESFIEEYELAEQAINGREEKLAAASEKVEVGLRFLGCTAIEDKLQDKVPETIDYLLKCDIRVWLLTGDKLETAINIGMSSKLINSKMTVHILEGKKTTDVSQHLARIRDKIETDAKDPSKQDIVNALVVQGETLAKIFGGSDDIQKEFLWVGTRCHSVICCRVTPLQKALVVNLVKKNVKCVTLAIGDGANDVSMIQAANIGVGIMGKEGTQAVRASDYAFAEFRFLKRLLCVHGRYSYMRLAQIIMFSFYKNITMITVMWWFGFQSLWSGQLVYEEIFMTAYNIVFTSLPPLVMAIFDRDVNDDMIDKYPALYREVKNNMYWNWWTVAGWMGSALWHCTVIFGSVWFINQDGNISFNGKTTGYWVQTTLLGTPVLLTVTLKYALATKTFVWVTAAAIGISLALNMLGIFILEYFGFSETGNGVISHILPVYYLICVLMPVMANLPDLLFMFSKRQFKPHDADIICEEASMMKKLEGKKKTSNIVPDMEQVRH